MDEIRRITETYEESYKINWEDYGYIWHPRNPISMYYRQKREIELVKLLNKYKIDLIKSKILDVGCGYGNTLRFFIELGAKPENLHGIDLMDYRIEKALYINPNINYKIGNADSLPYSDGTFDIVVQFVVFSSILDENIRVNIAKEMIRVLKEKGIIIWYDMKNKFKNPTNINGININEIKRLFSNCRIVELSTLHHSYINQLAKYSYFLCEILERIPLIKKTHYLGLLEKI